MLGRLLRSLLFQFLPAVLLTLNPVAFSHEYPHCKNLDSSSCWQAINETHQNISLACNLQGIGTQLSPLQAHSYQYCTGWGDGLGFPEPNRRIECKVSRDGTESPSFEIHTLGWGDRVQIRITERSIFVRLREYWKSYEKTLEFPLLFY